MKTIFFSVPKSNEHKFFAYLVINAIRTYFPHEKVMVLDFSQKSQTFSSKKAKELVILDNKSEELLEFNLNKQDFAYEEILQAINYKENRFLCLYNQDQNFTIIDKGDKISEFNTDVKSKAQAENVNFLFVFIPSEARNKNDFIHLADEVYKIRAVGNPIVGDVDLESTETVFFDDSLIKDINTGIKSIPQVKNKDSFASDWLLSLFEIVEKIKGEDIIFTLIKDKIKYESKHLKMIESVGKICRNYQEYEEITGYSLVEIENEGREDKDHAYTQDYDQLGDDIIIHNIITALKRALEEKTASGISDEFFGPLDDLLKGLDIEIGDDNQIVVYDLVRKLEGNNKELKTTVEEQKEDIEKLNEQIIEQSQPSSSSEKYIEGCPGCEHTKKAIETFNQDQSLELEDIDDVLNCYKQIKTNSNRVFAANEKTKRLEKDNAEKLTKLERDLNERNLTNNRLEGEIKDLRVLKDIKDNKNIEIALKYLEKNDEYRKQIEDLGVSVVKYKDDNSKLSNRITAREGVAFQLRENLKAFVKKENVTIEQAMDKINEIKNKLRIEGE